METAREKNIYKATWIGFFVNLSLSAVKLLAGVFGRSGAMVADAVHSLSDFATDVVVLAFVKLSAKPKDDDHDYGHGKYETLATVVVGLALAGVAVGIFVDSAGRIAQVVRGEAIERPGLVALLAAALSIAAKETLYRYTMAVAKRTESPALKANAWHHRSDALSSVGTLLGIGGAYFLSERWRVLDPIAAIVVGALIVKVAYGLVSQGVNELLERSLPAEQENEIADLVLADGRLRDLHNLKTRRIGSGIAIELHVRVRGDMTVDESHAITRDIERRLRQRYGERTQVIIHIEPMK